MPAESTKHFGSISECECLFANAPAASISFFTQTERECCFDFSFTLTAWRQAERKPHPIIPHNCHHCADIAPAKGNKDRQLKLVTVFYTICWAHPINLKFFSKTFRDKMKCKINEFESLESYFYYILIWCPSIFVCFKNHPFAAIAASQTPAAVTFTPCFLKCLPHLGLVWLTLFLSFKYHVVRG